MSLSISKVSQTLFLKDLIEQYGLEKDAIDQLVKSYNNLQGYISKERAEKAMQAAISANKEMDNANALLVDAANNVKTSLGWQMLDGSNRYAIGFGSPSRKVDKGLEEQIQIMILKVEKALQYRILQKAFYRVMIKLKK